MKQYDFPRSIPQLEITGHALWAIAQIKAGHRAVERMQSDTDRRGADARRRIIVQANRAFELFDQTLAALEGIQERTDLLSASGLKESNILLCNDLMICEASIELSHNQLVLNDIRFRGRHQPAGTRPLHRAIEDLSLVRECLYVIPYQ